MENQEKTLKERWFVLKNTLGRKSVKSKDWETAKRVYEGVAKHNYQYPVCRITSDLFLPDILGHCYEQLGDLGKARQSYIRSAKIYQAQGNEGFVLELVERAKQLEDKLGEISKKAKSELEEDVEQIEDIYKVQRYRWDAPVWRY
tara:strand:+ start:86 stop:520 length:435 start_codon:yes stop_codon:yes gene_type:complete